MKRTGELFSNEFALTRSETGERLHATIFGKGVELGEGNAVIPVSLELVSLLNEYDLRSCGDDCTILEARIRKIADTIVREMKGDRVSKELTFIFGDHEKDVNLYVNWRAVVLKLHETLAHMEGLVDILELHSAPKVRKQVALPAHPSRALLKSKELSAQQINGGEDGKLRVPLFHR
jgi:hypothetical protein